MTENNIGHAFAVEMAKDVIEAFVMKSSSKRETFKKHITNISSLIGQTSNQLSKQTTNLFGLFNEPNAAESPEDTGTSKRDAKWVELHN